MQNDKPNKKLWLRLALLGASLSILTILILTACDLMGIGPNLGLYPLFEEVTYEETDTYRVYRGDDIGFRVVVSPFVTDSER